MRLLLLAACAALLSGQTQTRTTSYRGANGETVALPEPKVKVEEKVLRDDSGGRLVERIVRPFDIDGRPLAPEKTVIEEVKGADGSISVKTSVYKGDVSGNLRLAEREIRAVSGSKELTNEVRTVERPDVNGGFAVAERSQTVIRSSDSASDRDTVVYRPALSGKFEAAYREVSQTTRRDGRTEERTAKYESASTGRMELTGQETSATTKLPDGTEVKEITIYGIAAPGRAAQPGTPQLREQRVVETRPAPGGTVETVSIRRPSADDQKLPSGYTKVSETVCVGCTLAVASGAQSTSASPAQTASPKN